MSGCLYTSERTSVIHQDILDYVDELSEEVNKIKTDMQKLKLEFLHLCTFKTPNLHEIL